MSLSLPDRRKAPALHLASEIVLLHGSEHDLPQGSKLYALPGGQQPACRLDVVYSVGQGLGDKPVLSWLLSQLLGEGTRQKSADAWHLALESTGAYMHRSFSGDLLQLSFYFLEEQWSAVLPLIREALFESDFPQNEVDLLVHNQKAALAQQAQKVAWQANKKAKSLFFEGHTYGWLLTEEQLQGFQSTELKAWYQRELLGLRPSFYFSGGFSPATLNALCASLAEWPLGQRDAQPLVRPGTYMPGQHHVAMENKSQAALRVYSPSPSPLEPNYAAVHAMLTLFGGFFGSRLMKNIREEKGLTYGIGTGFAHLRLASAWTLATEVNRNKLEEALLEVQKEARKMMELSIPEEELQLVKNYIAGQRARAFDGPFLQMDQWIWRNTMGLDAAWIVKQQRELKNLKPEDLQSAAQKYLPEDQWLVAWAG
jgi:predicted Zn-dependent peptidase